jgi:hypothetical protein
MRENPVMHWRNTDYPVGCKEQFKQLKRKNLNIDQIAYFSNIK